MCPYAALQIFAFNYVLSFIVKISGENQNKYVFTSYHKDMILSSLFEKLRDARDKTLVSKNRKPKKIV